MEGPGDDHPSSFEEPCSCFQSLPGLSPRRAACALPSGVTQTQRYSKQLIAKSDSVSFVALGRRGAA